MSDTALPKPTISPPSQKNSSSNSSQKSNTSDSNTTPKPIFSAPDSRQDATSKKIDKKPVSNSTEPQKTDNDSQQSKPSKQGILPPQKPKNPAPIDSSPTQPPNSTSKPTATPLPSPTVASTTTQGLGKTTTSMVQSPQGGSLLQKPTLQTSPSSNSNSNPAGQAMRPLKPPTSPSMGQANTISPNPGSVMRPPANMTALRTVSSNTLPPGATAPPPVTPQQPTATPKKAVFATASKSPMRFLPFILGGLVIVAILGFIAFRFIFSGGSDQDADVPVRSPVASSTPDQGRTVVPGTQTTISYWGLWEPEEIIEEIIDDFETEHPDIDVVFVPQSHKDYRERLQTAIASGQGPDVFRFHGSWTPMLSDELYPVPASLVSSSEFQATYYPVMAKQLQNNGQFVGIPLMYDGLALFYNEDILNTASEQPPQTWSELRSLAAKLTIRTGNEVKRGGVALGNATNVEHFSDILAVLMLQNGADLANPNTPEGKDALKFYTNFLKEDKVWSDSLPSSTVAFARGDVAMMFAPSWRAHEIQAINPDLRFGVTTIPRLAETRISWASYWAEGVNARSENTDEAWQFVEYLASEEVLKKLYASQSEVRSFGELYPRVNMADLVAQDPIVTPFLQDAPYSKGWYMSSFTHDNGINDLIIKYYEDAISAVLANTSTDEAMTTVDQGVKQVLRQYNAQ